VVSSHPFSLAQVRALRLFLTSYYDLVLIPFSGYTVVFADVDKSLIDTINEENHYDVHVLDQHTTQFAVDDVMGVLSTTEDVVRAIADPNAHVLTTAVGVNILDRIAPTIAKGLIKRREIGGDVMNIIACEVRRDHLFPF
jgi:mannitol-1-phosphate 5-dehydrogenase